jgi:hypothetical protein
MTNIEAARILSAIMEGQLMYHPKHRDLDNEQMLALGKAIKVLRKHHDIQSSKKKEDPRQ